jgi:hypothetical protein
MQTSITTPTGADPAQNNATLCFFEPPITIESSSRKKLSWRPVLKLRCYCSSAVLPAGQTVLDIHQVALYGLKRIFAGHFICLKTFIPDASIVLLLTVLFLSLIIDSAHALRSKLQPPMKAGLLAA